MSLLIQYFNCVCSSSINLLNMFLLCATYKHDMFAFNTFYTSGEYNPTNLISICTLLTVLFIHLWSARLNGFNIAVSVN